MGYTSVFVLRDFSPATGRASKLEPPMSTPMITTMSSPSEHDLHEPDLGELTQLRKFPPHPGKLLVADDEHLVASGVSGNLRELGYEVVGPAADGDEAIDLCRLHRPDMALLDIRMPKKDGLAAAEILFRRMGIPVMIFSAYSDPEYVTTGNRIGVFGYLLKPVTPDQMRVGISVAWGRFLDHSNQNSEITTLKERLEHRKIIEQAKWLIVKRKGIDEPEAMKLLQKQARNNRRTLVDVSRSLLENDNLLGT
jgi:AmiR/NasT family two-component response regulator